MLFRLVLNTDAGIVRSLLVEYRNIESLSMALYHPEGDGYHILRMIETWLDSVGMKLFSCKYVLAMDNIPSDTDTVIRPPVIG